MEVTTVKAAKNGLILTCVIVAICATPSVRADFLFGEATNLGATVNSAAGDFSCCVSYDGLELYFSSNRAGGQGGSDLWVCTRSTRQEAWGAPQNLGPLVNSPQADLSPSISADGLELYLHSNGRSGGFGGSNIWVTRRAATDAPWSSAENLGPAVNNAGWVAYNPCIACDGLTLYFAWGGWVAVTKRAAPDAPWEQPVDLTTVVNNWESQDTPWISSDGRLLVFTDNAPYTPRPGGFGGTDVWYSRSTAAGVGVHSLYNPYAWEPPVNAGSLVNTSSRDDWSMISPDGSMLYYSSERAGGFGSLDLWQAPIVPIVDFTGDGQVDEKELRIMVACWDTNDRLCDIGPMPWGDGVVDIQDLKVLANSIGAEVSDPTLVAHWALDETEGTTAHDSAGDHDGAILGAPLWRPEGGRIGGALELSGVPNLVATPFVRDPSQGPLSVFAWVKGGEPGQVVVSQESGGGNWLMASADGALMTELQSGGRITSALTSTAVITDSDWHRIGLTWDGANRTLYVDDVAVAADAQTSLAGSTGDLLLGASAKPGAGSFWKGLIDDVRIYSRAVRP